MRELVWLIYKSSQKEARINRRGDRKGRHYYTRERSRRNIVVAILAVAMWTCIDTMTCVDTRITFQRGFFNGTSRPPARQMAAVSHLGQHRTAIVWRRRIDQFLDSAHVYREAQMALNGRVRLLLELMCIDQGVR